MINTKRNMVTEYKSKRIYEGKKYLKAVIPCTGQDQSTTGEHCLVNGGLSKAIKTMGKHRSACLFRILFSQIDQSLVFFIDHFSIFGNKYAAVEAASQ